jgi:radical SAM protein with 4Fe4S-binding SPASM domain
MGDTITTRIDAIARIPVHMRAEVLSAPRSVKIELTGRCNYRCSFCALAMRDEQPKKDIDWNLFCRITREMREAGVEEIGVFFIGESFINPDLLVNAIEHLKRKVGMPYVFLTSNASLAHPAIVERCMEAGLDSLKWSVNATEEQYRSVLNVSEKLSEKVKRNIKEAWRIKWEGDYKTRLYASSIRYDGEQHERMEAMLKEHVLPYVDEHYWLPLYSMGSLTTSESGKRGFVPIAGNRGRYDNPVDPLPCWSVFTEGHVMSDGRLSACCFDATGEWVVGDLNKQGFMEAWNSTAFQELRRAHLKKDVAGTKCENCIAVKPHSA